MTRLLSLLLVVGLLVQLSACDSSDPAAERVTVTATVTNSFGQPLDEGTVAFGTACTAETETDGSFSCTLPVGTYEVTVSVPGYTPQTVTLTLSASGPVTIPSLSGPGILDVELVNALTGEPILSAPVECRRLMRNGATSGVEFMTMTTTEGRIILSGVFTGDADCRVQIGDQWVPFQVTLSDNTTGTLAATPPPAEGSFRIVLSWGENPSDLDSHLTGPDGAGGRFHVYYSSREFGETMLDLDDTSSFGPETVTLVPTSDGLYRYSVHNYSTQDGTGGQGIFDSPATVRVYNGDGLLRTYVAPEPTASNDGLVANTWCVFEMTISGSTVTFDGAAPNGMGYLMASSSGDTTVFLTNRGDTGGDKPVAF